MSIIGWPTRAHAPLRALAPCAPGLLGLIIGHMRARVGDRLAHSRRAIAARLDRGNATRREIPGPIVFTALGGAERLVITTPERFRAEPLGARFDCYLSDCGRVVMYREPIAACNRPATT